MTHWLHSWLAVGTVCGVLITAPAASTDSPAKTKPKPAVGVDPGGVMVAFVGSGLDYTRTVLAARLARDGEGEIVGFDLVDRDRRPHCATVCAAESDAAEALLVAAPQVRIAIFKVDGAPLAAPAMQMAVQAKADILIVTLPNLPQTHALLRAAADRFRDALIVWVAKPAAVEAEGSDSGRTSAVPSPPEADKPVLPDTVLTIDGPTETTPSDVMRRAAGLAAKAAKIVALSPSTRGAALKAQVLAADPTAVRTP